MALETLKGIEKIGDFSVIIMDELRAKFPEKFNEKGGMDYQWFEKEIRPNNFVYIRNDVNSIAFTIQKGPVKDVGVNGCQVDTIIEAALFILQGLHEKFPCKENGEAMSSLNDALDALKARKENRESRGVEGRDVE